MFEKLSDSQKRIVDCNASRIVVKACPGSGKTFSITARLAKLLRNDNSYKHQGIAALSFTNIACEEMRKGLNSEYSICDIKYPHFIGTIDSFINNYIFFPFGHLLMGCNHRPEIIGTEYNKWLDYDVSLNRSVWTNGQRIITYREPNYYFDKVSFDVSDGPIPLTPASSFHFSWSKMRNKDGAFCKNIVDIISAKKSHFAEGKANQADANYFAFKILCMYPSIAKNIVQRFPTIIVDEAQDTTTIQMAIVDILDRAGAESIMLMGDPDQAIFEWNTANPSLFMDKYNSDNWEGLDLSENRRSSTNICSVINRFFGGTMDSVAESRDCHEIPELKQHQTNSESINSIIEEFRTKCAGMGIEDNSYSIVYRGRTFGEKYLNLSDESSNIGNSMWVNGGYFVRDIVHGKYLIDNGQFKRGLHLIEKGYLKMKYGLKYVSIKQSKEEVEKYGYRNFRQVIFRFIDSLPLTNQTLNNWIINANSNGNEFSVNSIKANIDISRIFHNETINISPPSYFKTIHSVKGMSLEAILVFITKGSAGKDYSTIFSRRYNEPDINKRRKDEEEIRIIYVACLHIPAIPVHPFR